MKRAVIVILILACALSLGMGCNKNKKDKGKPGAAAKKSKSPGAGVKCPDGMAGIPGGQFTMGCAEQNLGTCYDDEKPAKSVTIKKFCMDKKEVTQKQYESVMGLNPAQFKSCGGGCPVELVSWPEARTYCEKVKKRLPTEAEWERAARAGSDARFPWKAESVAGNAWFAETSGGTSHPAGQKKPNAYGLFDAAGNVQEWTMDCYDPVWYSRMPADNPVNAGPVCDLHTVRGGSWATKAENAAMSDRSGFSTDIKTPFIGFRCAADAK